jgi:hypothetical protein
MTPEQQDAWADEAADRTRKTMRERLEAVGERLLTLPEQERRGREAADRAGVAPEINAL